MALDNAQFISELSITDPPGTDPLSQGDDQIRTIKRATQQSFPNIDKAVTQTADQMLLMAIKNEANIFSVGGNQFTNAVEFQRSALTTIAQMRFRTEAAVDRWDIVMRPDADNDNWALQRRGITGTFIDFPMQCDSTTGVVDFRSPPTVLGAPIWIAGEIRMFVANTSLGTNWFIADGTSGTVDLSDRYLGVTGTNLGSPGGSVVPNLVGTASAGTTGATAISSAQMPSHRHRIRSGGASGITDVALGNVSTQTVVGANRGNTASQFFDANSGGQQFIENTGSGSTHTHSSPAQAVVENGTDVNTVRPRTFTVRAFQYVP